MKITKSELREMIRSVVREELRESYKLTEARQVPEESVLANHIGNDSTFEEACYSGDAAQIMAIIDNKMEELNMYTPGAKKFRNTVFKMTGGRPRISTGIATRILIYVSNCRLASYDLRAPGRNAYNY